MTSIGRSLGAVHPGSDGGKVAQGFYDIYRSFGTMTPGQQESTSAPGTVAADVAQAATAGLRGRP